MAVQPYTEKKEDELRKIWNVGSLVLIYSRSKNKWFDGIIEKIEGDTKNEWLVVKYGDFNSKKKQTKKIQRNCKDIQPIPIDHPSYFIKGSKCKIYSTLTSLWCHGEVIDIFHDEQGEWLQVQYSEDDTTKICDIQRYSEDIKLVIDDTDSFVSELVTLGVGEKDEIMDAIKHVVNKRDINEITNYIIKVQQKLHDKQLQSGMQ